ncbi:MAG: ABC transporter ATP-binding protein [Pseudomonadota bacterium]
MTAPLLSSTDLVVGYGGEPVLRDISFGLDRGGVTLLGGRNGAGKSSLIKALTGLLPTGDGQLTFDGTSLSSPGISLDPVQRARLGLGYVPETRRVFASLTVAENLAAGQRAGPGPIWSTTSVLDLFPPLAPLMGRRAGALSGGEQQMLSIARTLMGRPKLLLLDEASEGLAPLIVKALSQSLKTLSERGLTILMAEQNWRFAKDIADHVLILDHGKIAYEGTMVQFTANETLQIDLLGAQG